MATAKKPAALKPPAKLTPPAPKKGRVLDLNAARAARAEADREPLVVQIGTEEFTLPVEMAYDVIRLGALGDLDGAVRELLGGDMADVARLLAQKPSMDDLSALVDGAYAAYGVDQGK